MNARTNPGYVDAAFLQRMFQFVLPVKQRSYELMELRGGHHVLDVGCGPAVDTISLAQIVGPEGEVVGVDYDEEMVALARQRAGEAGVSTYVRHDQGDATALPYEDGSFDASRSERLFQHVADPAGVLAEMVRVTKSAGRVVVVDTDHSSVAIDCADPDVIDIEWRIRRCQAEFYLNGYSGRQLYRLFKEAGLNDVTVQLYALSATDYSLARYVGRLDHTEQRALADGVVSEDELQRWHAMLEEADARGVFFGYAVMAVAVGRKF